LVLPTLLNGNPSTSIRDEAETARQATLAILRDQMAQLNADLAAGTLDAEQHRTSSAEIERRVIEETAAVEASVATAAPRAGSGKPWATIVVIALAIPLLATYGYEHLGNPAAIEPPAAEAAPALADGVTNDQVEVLVKQLAERMKSNPDDLEGWTLLARTYAAMQKFPEAAQAFERATALSPNDASLLADRADVMAVLQGQRAAGEPAKLIARALELDPKNLKALALAGSVALAVIGLQGGPQWPQTTLGWQGLGLLTFLYGTAFTIMFTVLPKLGVAANSAIMNVEPVFALGLGWAVLDQQVAWVQVGGALLVVSVVVGLGLRKQSA